MTATCQSLFTVTLEMESGPFVIPGIIAINECYAVARACEIAASMDYQPSNLRGVKVRAEGVSYRNLH